MTTRLTKLAQEAAHWGAGPVDAGKWDTAPEAVPRADESTAMSLRVPKRMLTILKEFARREGVGYQVLMKRWLDDRIRAEAKRAGLDVYQGSEPLLDDRYTYRVTWSDEDRGYLGLCAEFPSLSWIAPATKRRSRAFGASSLGSWRTCGLRERKFPNPSPREGSRASSKSACPRIFTVALRSRPPRRASAWMGWWRRSWGRDGSRPRDPEVAVIVASNFPFRPPCSVDRRHGERAQHSTPQLTRLDLASSPSSSTDGIPSFESAPSRVDVRVPQLP